MARDALCTRFERRLIGTRRWLLGDSLGEASLGGGAAATNGSRIATAMCSVACCGMPVCGRLDTWETATRCDELEGLSSGGRCRDCLRPLPGARWLESREERDSLQELQAAVGLEDDGLAVIGLTACMHRQGSPRPSSKV